MMENKNIVSGNGSATLITIPFDHNFTKNDAILHIRRLKELFHKFIICLWNIELVIFTSPTKRFVDEFECYTHNSKPAEDIDRLSSMYDNFLIFWNNKDECRLIPDSVGSGKLFKRVKLERALHKSSAVNVFPGSLLHERCSHSSPCGTAVCKYTASQIPVTGIKFNTSDEDYKTLEHRQVSLKYLKKVLPARNEWSYVYPVSGGFPTQESSAEGNKTFVSNSGSSYQFPVVSVGGYTLNRENSLSAEASGLAIGRQTRPPRYSQYEDVSARLRTYARWVRQSPNPRQLAEAGFFFTNEGDLVRCFQCGLGLKDFSVDDDPLLEHVRHSGDCEHLYDYLGPSQLAEFQKRIFRGSNEEQSRQLQLQHHSRDIPEVNYNCRHPRYRTLEARMATFDKWPRTMVQTPRQLAEAGLYYTGFEDHVRCFACDGGLRRWDAEDDPWTEHCRWFPTCPFARKQKGDEYIALVQASVDQEHDETTTTGAADLTHTMAQMTLVDPQFQAIMREHKQACLEMGFKENDFNDTVQELRNRGNIKPSLEDIVDNIAVVVENREAAKRTETIQNETPQEENRRLKKFFMCMACEENKVNVLFLPCTHHRLCMECAKPLFKCPVCDRDIREKIKTFLV